MIVVWCGVAGSVDFESEKSGLSTMDKRVQNTLYIMAI